MPKWIFQKTSGDQQGERAIRSFTQDCDCKILVEKQPTSQDQFVPILESPPNLSSNLKFSEVRGLQKFIFSRVQLHCTFDNVAENQLLAIWGSQLFYNLIKSDMIAKKTLK